jgi:ribosomal protein L22
MATNTEKPSTKAEQKKKMSVSQPKLQKVEGKTPLKKEKKLEEKKTEETKENEKVLEEEKIEEKKEKKIEVKKVKKDFVFVDSKSLPISTKQAKFICKFIKNKPIQTAIKELEEVTKLKKAIPMTGEIPHRKGRIMSGRFPVRASNHIIKILKGLQGNANQHEIDEPIISEAIANLAQRPYGRFGSIRKKRSHVKIIAYEKSKLKSKRKKKEKKLKK